MSLESNKIACFEFMMDELVAWVIKLGGDPKTELNLLKVIKLNFFIAAASSSEGEKGLLEVFDNFHAMPYGHVESSVYDAVKGIPGLSKYSLKGGSIEWNQNSIHLDILSQNRIKDSILKIRSIDDKFVLKSGAYLVDLSHTWHSWRLFYSLAKSMDKKSMKIPIEVIQRETKIFSLERI